MAVKCMNMIDNNAALHKAVVELFADTKIEVTSDMEIRDFPPGYEIEMGSILTTGDFNVAVMGSDGIWKWEENSSSRTAFNGELTYDGTILEGYKVSVKVPSGITKIGDNAFKNLTGLENVNITEGVTLIGDYAFYGCTDLKTVKIASTVTGIGDSAFEGCTGLETVYCEPTTPPSLGTDAFDGITSNCVIYVPDNSYIAYVTSWSDMTDYILPEGGVEEVTITGNPISMSDAVAHNAISTILSYSPRQSGTGDPSPQNVRPIEGWTEANLTGTGKNLFDVDSVSVGIIEVALGEEDLRNRSGFYYTLPKGTYTARCNSDDVQSYIYLSVMNSDNSFSSRAALSVLDTSGWRAVSFTVETGQKIAIYAASSGKVLALDFMLQIEVGTVPTDYVPFITPTTTTISLVGTYYGFTVDLENGIASIKWIVVQPKSSDSWLEYTVAGVYVWNKYLPIGKYVRENMVCSHNTTQYFSFANNSKNRFQFSIGAWNDTDLISFKAFLDEQESLGTPVQIVYELETPTELPLTPQTVALLAGNNTLWTEGDSVALTYLAIASQHQEPTPLLGLTSLSRGVSDEEKDPDTIEEPIEEEFIENLEENLEEDIIDTPVEEETTENDER